MEGFRFLPLCVLFVKCTVVLGNGYDIRSTNFSIPRVDLPLSPRPSINNTSRSTRGPSILFTDAFCDLLSISRIVLSVISGELLSKSTLGRSLNWHHPTNITYNYYIINLMKLTISVSLLAITIPFIPSFISINDANDTYNVLLR